MCTKLKSYQSEISSSRCPELKRIQYDSHQFGRSMVEMLGVLAIIGVLSIGGLYAYKQVMARYYANQVADFIARVQQYVAEVCFYNNEACPFSEGAKTGSSLLCGSGILTTAECEKTCLSFGYLKLPYETGEMCWAIDKQNNNTLVVLNIMHMSKDVCIQMANKNYRYIYSVNADYPNTGYQPAQNGLLSEAAKEQFIKDCANRDSGRFVLTWQTEK